MIQEGHVILFRFPQAHLEAGKLRPALVLRSLPGPYGDWLICMISSQTHQAIPGFDEILEVGDPDFAPSGLKITSVIRISRLAVVESRVFLGRLGHIAPPAHGQNPTEPLRLDSMRIAGP